MKDAEVFGKDIQGSFRTLKFNPDGELMTATAATGSGASDLGKAEDAAHVSGDVGVEVLGVRNDANTTLTSADGDYSPVAVDKIGRPIIQPYQIRGLISTGYSVLTRSQEITIVSATAGSYLDLVEVTGSSTSTVAIPVVIRNVLAGNVIDRIVIPAGNTISRDYVVPHPASDTGNVLTAQVDVTDQSDSTVNISMIAIRNT